ncbi:helix-turn-helix domain-containing protein [Actinomyces viscosus]|uniref:L-rhamnose operon transcriptional activator rhaR n=1 Tax=Actinomyces viscosus TaxID=1656 RepID=A0A3S4Z9E7_ACTVI|nr:helix-turn-helix domain-containing protein [Actinomyces viscosus]TFH51329.1 helix-turn-helix domain-containing protein [Actinomyces viscosus]VEI17070.1 L-rhamnose operon transcriptional activator rhaR [Actinomyces viscosus]
MRIAVYAFDGITMFHLSIPQMVFGTVSRLGLADWRTSLFTIGPGAAVPAGDSTSSADRTDPTPPAPAPSSASLRTSEGYVLSGLGGPELAQEADVVVVPAWFADGRPAGRELCSLLKAAHTRGASVAGLCLGAIPLAEAGLIGGRRAVTHWRAFEPLAREHPEIALDESVLYVDHGDVLTSAGAASGLDACLHLVRVRLGAQAANEVARQLVIAPHREGGQAQYIERPVPHHADDDPIGRTTTWALAHLGEPLPVKRLARRAQMSTRSFIRSFRRATGTAPAAWVRAQRVREAQRLLESTDLAIERVASVCGFGSAVTMRQAFTRALGTTPSAYRRRFRTTPSPPSPSTVP